MLKEFKSFVEKHNLIGRDDRVLLALSGGVDSMVLAKLLLLRLQDYKTTRLQGSRRDAELQSRRVLRFDRLSDRKAQYVPNIFRKNHSIETSDKITKNINFILIKS